MSDDAPKPPVSRLDLLRDAFGGESAAEGSAVPPLVYEPSPGARPEVVVVAIAEVPQGTDVVSIIVDAARKRARS
jgi:hypothetical protein